MGSHGIFIELPDELYARLNHTATESELPIEVALIEALGLLYGVGGSERSTSILKTFSDEQLWTVVNQRLTAEENERVEQLMAQVKNASLPAEQQAELDGLVKKINRQMVIRSKALALLQVRGHDIQGYLADFE